VNSSDQFRELIEAYALGSLDLAERTAVAAHLETHCPECTKALEEARQLVSQLAYLAPTAAPSGMLRETLLQTIRAEVATVKPAGETAALRSAIPFWMWGAVAAALLFALYNAYETSSLQEKIHGLQESLSAQAKLQHESAQQLAAAQREALILTDPKSVKIVMPAGDRNLPALQVAWHQELGIVVSGQKLPTMSQNRTLQLWLILNVPGAKPVPSLTLRPDSEGQFDLLIANPPGVPSGTKALAITEEPEGGSQQPTTTPIWVGTVAAK
jgi:anti-sigma factor RsiW